MNKEQIEKLREVMENYKANPHDAEAIGMWHGAIIQAGPALVALAERALLAAAPAPIQQEQSEWRIVPVEPTRDMWTAANKADDAAYAGGSQHGADIATLWEAMLDAAPVRPTQLATTMHNENNDLSNKNESEEAALVPPALAGSQVQAAGDAVVDDLAMLVRRLVRSLEKANPGTDLAPQALDYLKRKGLQGSPLREQQT